MTDRELLLRAVLADPADDLARHAFADWCEESGDLQGDRPRAAFIRDQLKCAALVAAGDARSRGLVEAHWRGFVHLCALRECEPPERRKWHPEYAEKGRRASFGRLRVVVPGGAFAAWMSYRRGFVERVCMTAEGFLNEAESMFRKQPITEVLWADHQLVPFRASRGVTAWHWDFSTRPGRDEWPAELLALDHSAACVAYGRRLAGLPPLTLTAPP